MYIGRAKLQSKKITCAHIDDLYNKLLKKEQERKKVFEDKQEQRRRHGSGVSTKSLPATLEENVTVTENELQKQHSIFTDSPASSNDELSSLSSDHQSSSENILSNSDHFPSGLSHFGELHDLGELAKDEALNKVLTKSDNEHSHKDLHVHFNETCLNADQVLNPNRTMLFRLGANEVSLISLDKKTTILDKRFKDISSVSQVSMETTWPSCSKLYLLDKYLSAGFLSACPFMYCSTFSQTIKIMYVRFHKSQLTIFYFYFNRCISGLPLFPPSGMECSLSKYANI